MILNDLTTVAIFNIRLPDLDIIPVCYSTYIRGQQLTRVPKSFNNLPAKLKAHA